MYKACNGEIFEPAGRKCLLILHDKKEGARQLALNAADYLRSHQYQVDSISYDLLPKCECHQYTFALLFGGDGLALMAGVYLSRCHLPILVINLGQVGFMAAFDLESWQHALDELMAGRLGIRRHQALEFSLDDWATHHLAMNEVFLAAEERFKICEFDLSIGFGDSLGLMRSDGLMISTPTGSTGHALSCGGPLLDTDVQALLILAVNPYTTAYRPLLISDRQSVRVRLARSNRNKVLLIRDGSCMTELQPQMTLQLRLSGQYADFICARGHSFYQTIQKKLGWNAGIIYQKDGA